MSNQMEIKLGVNCQKLKDQKVKGSITNIGIRSHQYSAYLVALLEDCCCRKDLHKGSIIHADILQKGCPEIDRFIASALVNMYAKCGALNKAQDVFDNLRIRDLVTWTILISGYMRHGHGQNALNCFHQMQCEGLLPDAISFTCLLKACGSMQSAEKGKEIHAKIAREGLRCDDPVLGSALLDMYGKCGALTEAQQVFDELQVRNIVSWTALITSYCQQDEGDKALSCFQRMLCEGHSPNSLTFSCILKACGSIGVPEKGKEIHAEIVREGLLQHDSVLGNGLVDMYAKCGLLVKAQKVFDSLPIRNVITWTALIAGYAQLGKHDVVFCLFQKMEDNGIAPNFVTFLVVLNACSFSALVSEGETYFEAMTTMYGIIPTLEHQTCMVDLYGRAGHFEKAIAVIQKLPDSNYLPLWSALLVACLKWGNVKLGRFAFEHTIQLNGKSTDFDATFGTRGCK